MAGQIQLICPNCGRTLEIPEELETFSCLYCGERLRTATVLAMQERTGNQYAALREQLRSELPETVTKYPDLLANINKKEYAAAFERYRHENEDVLTNLDICVRLRAGKAQEAARELCTDFLDSLEAYMQADPRWEKKAKKQDLMLEVKVVLALFLTPLIRKLQLECAEPFCAELHRQWMDRWPKDKWIPGDYDAIVGGFRRGKLCFITTAVCRSEGKPDHCAELTAFRKFRDGWLTEHGGQAQIEQYYALAPSIVVCMDYCDDGPVRCAELRRRWLAPCYLALQEERYEDCRRIYTEMVQTLAQRYRQS